MHHLALEHGAVPILQRFGIVGLQDDVGDPIGAAILASFECTGRIIGSIEVGNRVSFLPPRIDLNVPG
jgi:hypothetical protein